MKRNADIGLTSIPAKDGSRTHPSTRTRLGYAKVIRTDRPEKLKANTLQWLRKEFEIKAPQAAGGEAYWWYAAVATL